MKIELRKLPDPDDGNGIEPSEGWMLCVDKTSKSHLKMKIKQGKIQDRTIDGAIGFSKKYERFVSTMWQTERTSECSSLLN